MTLLMILLCITGQSSNDEESSYSHGFRLGIGLTTSIPSMQMEKEYADMNSEAGIGYDLSTFAGGTSIELLGDLSERLRIRGSVGVTEFKGEYRNTLIILDDRAISVEAQAYFLLNRGKDISFSAGAGPTYTWVRRNLNSFYTSTSGSGSGFGLVTSIRLDQEWPWKIGNISILMALEAGYRLNNIKLDNEEADGFELDFSGPFLKIGSYIGL